MKDKALLPRWHNLVLQWIANPCPSGLLGSNPSLGVFFSFIIKSPKYTFLKTFNQNVYIYPNDSKYIII